MTVSLFNKGDQGSQASKVLASVKHDLAQPLVSKELASATISMEGFSPALENDLKTAEQNLTAVLKRTFSDVKGYASLNVAQEQASIVAGLNAYSPEQFLSKQVVSHGALKARESETVIVMAPSVSGMDARVSMEAFDERANKNTVAYSMMYNAQASRQNEFGEAFYPTVVQTPDQVGYTVNVRLVEIIETVRRDISGKVTNFNRRNIITAERDYKILENEVTKIVPVFRTGVSESFFSTDVPAVPALHAGETIDTAPLAVGKRIDLLGISQTAASLAAGVHDETDAIDSAAKLLNVYVKLADGDVIKFKVNNVPTAAFNAAIQGNARQLNLAFQSNSIQVSDKTKTVSGAALTGAAALGTNTVRLDMALFGSINQQQGDTSISANPVELHKVFDEAGVEIPSATGPGAAVAALFTGAVVVGFDLDAYRTNSNRRNRGQLVDSREMNYLYTVPLLSPITALRPVTSSDSNDAAQINTLVTTTRIRTSNAAVTALFEAKAQLRDMVSPSNSAADHISVYGAASQLVIPAYAEYALDVSTMLDSLTSSQRTEDVVALILNKLRDMAYRLYRDSNYQAAADAMTGGAASKPVVIIGTDPVLYRYLTQTGDTRTLGDGFNFKIVTTTDTRMANKIIFSFGSNASFTDGVPNALHFGNMAWKPELTFVMPSTRNGANPMELTVQPSFLHINNLPIMGFLEVQNIEDIIAAKTTVNVSQ